MPGLFIMLRVGLTGSLGSGKSTVAVYLRQLGAEVIEADELGRALMEPGQPVFAGIVEHFGAEVVSAEGRLNRARLAALAFKEGRLQELNAIVHPAVIAAQRRWMREVFARNPAAIAVIESALIFEVERDALARGEEDGVLADWRRRFDRVVVVTAPEEVKIARWVARISSMGAGHATAEADARARLALQIPDAEKAARADFVVENSGDLAALRAETALLWQKLVEENNRNLLTESLE
jgi:dephospho-CoA kinase